MFHALALGTALSMVQPVPAPSPSPAPNVLTLQMQPDNYNFEFVVQRGDLFTQVTYGQFNSILPRCKRVSVTMFDEPNNSGLFVIARCLL